MGRIEEFQFASGLRAVLSQESRVKQAIMQNQARLRQGIKSLDLGFIIPVERGLHPLVGQLKKRYSCPVTIQGEPDERGYGWILPTLVLNAIEENLANPLRNAASSNIPDKKPKDPVSLIGFIPYFDAYTGVTAITANIEDAISIGDETDGEDLTQMMKDISESAFLKPSDSSSIIEDIEFYMQTMRQQALLRALFMQDPTCFSMIDETVKALDGNSDRLLPETKVHKIVIPEFFNMGINYASRLYKAIYPVIDSVLVLPR